jgi:hypothetical protein
MLVNQGIAYQTMVSIGRMAVQLRRSMWAEHGNLRFIRLDGGRIESWKADRTWWAKSSALRRK